MKSLPDSINALYSAFQDVPKPRRIQGCPCCLDNQAIENLLSKPLRDLTPDNLSSYAFSAFLTVGEEADYLYFFPRIIEISCAEGGWWVDIPITGRAISETRPHQWTDERRGALLDVLHAVIRGALVDDNDGARTIDEWICAISKMRLKVAPFLAQVETSPTRLLSYYEQNSRALMKDKLDNGFWDRDDLDYDTVLAWFKSPRISKMIFDGYGLTQNDP